MLATSQPIQTFISHSVNKSSLQFIQRLAILNQVHQDIIADYKGDIETEATKYVSFSVKNQVYWHLFMPYSCM